MTTDLIKTLEELDVKATKGPWRYDAGGGHAPNRIEGSESAHVSGDRPGTRSFSERICERLGDSNLEAPKANITLIVELRNSLPQIISALKESERYKQALESIVKYNGGEYKTAKEALTPTADTKESKK